MSSEICWKILEQTEFPMWKFMANPGRHSRIRTTLGTVFQDSGKNINKTYVQIEWNCGQSQTYTNHSTRATGATNLTKCMFSPPQIIVVIGHKLVQSLKVDQRPDKDEKIAVEQAIGQNLTNDLVKNISNFTTSPSGHQRIIYCPILTGQQFHNCRITGN